MFKTHCIIIRMDAMRAQWMGKGINIITPNKKLSSGPYERYQQLKKLQRQSYMHYFYEVHAHGLPIVSVSMVTGFASDPNKRRG